MAAEAKLTPAANRPVRESVSIVMGRDGGKSRGFAFVEMGSEEDAATAIAMIDGREVDGRTLTVSHAAPRINDREAVIV